MQVIISEGVSFGNFLQQGDESILTAPENRGRKNEQDCRRQGITPDQKEADEKSLRFLITQMLAWNQVIADIVAD